MLYTFCIVAFIKSYTLLPSFFLFLHKYRFPSFYRMCNILVTCHELWWHCKDWMSDNLRGITVVFCCLLLLWSKHYGISGSFLKLALEISIVVSFYSSFLMFLAWNVVFFFFFWSSLGEFSSGYNIEGKCLLSFPKWDLNPILTIKISILILNVLV
jgi:hypothetical protein